VNNRVIAIAFKRNVIVYHGGKRTAISEYGERQFRTKSYTDFGRSRTVVSADAERSFRFEAEQPGQLKQLRPGKTPGVEPVTSWKAETARS
jgi:hypothetical protein